MSQKMRHGEVVATLPCGVEIEARVKLSQFTSWLTGGVADHFVQPHTVEELSEAVAWAHLHGMPYSVLGGGTNVLISDQGVPGLTIALRKMAGAKVRERQGAADHLVHPAEGGAVDGETQLVIECLAGTSKSELLKIFLKNKLQPALFLAGLPGDVGGGIAMNAGVGEMLRPREFNEITDWVEVLLPPATNSVVGETTDAEILALVDAMPIRRFSADEIKWLYRHSHGWQPGIITRVGLSWPLVAMDDVLVKVKQANQTRLAKQPLDMPSCGSVFVNPPGHKAGQLIESNGLKGFTIGGAQVSHKHANFIVNTGEATSNDIHAVIRHVQKTVLEKSGVELKTEVVYMGRWS